MTPCATRVVLDIHGVLVGRDGQDVTPAGEVVAAIRDRGAVLHFLTNASSVGPDGVVELLASAGVGARPEEVLTAADTVAHFLRHRAAGRTVHVIGSDRLRQRLADLYPGVRWADPERAGAVVVTRDPTLSEATLDRLARNRQAAIYATCRDDSFHDGSAVTTGPGATVRLLEERLGRQATVLGKPNPYVLTDVLGLSPAQLRTTLVVGDSVSQDVLLARNAGARSVLLAPSTSGHAAGHAAGHGPDAVIHQFEEVTQWIPG